MSSTVAPSTAQKRKLPTSTSPSTTTTLPNSPTDTSPPPAITVVVKIRPPNQRELELAKASPQTNDLDFHSLSEDNQSITLDPITPPSKPSWSRFDNIFDSESDQTQLFDGTAMPIVRACLQGYNGCLMAYGQTGSGKTFSMTGPKDALTDPSRKHLQGIIPRSLDYLFETIKNMSGTGSKYQVQCSYFEIYNETINDLLLPPNTPPPHLAITTSGSTTSVVGITMVSIASVGEAIGVMEKGFAKRHTAATKMNSESSRSHAIFTIYLTSQSKSPTTGNLVERSSKLHFVDLAGSESAGKTGAKGETQREGANINASLLNLGKVIRELSQFEQQQAAAKKKANNSNGATLQPHFSYRGSKLTHILQDSFGKGNPLCLIANISPSRDNCQESKSTLTFASNARSLPKIIVKTKAKILTHVTNGNNGAKNDDNNNGENDDNSSDYLIILRSRYGGKADLLEAMLEQAYHTAVLWKRQRTGAYLQQHDGEND